MRVFAISDLHLSTNCNKPMDIFGPVWKDHLVSIEKSWKKNVHKKDIVLLAGDHSWAMKLDEAQPDLDYISSFKGTKVLIKGNHDYWWSSISGVRSRLGENTFAIQNDALKFGKYVICGTRGWKVPEDGKFQTEADKKIYDREVVRLELALKAAEKLRGKRDKLIVMLHYPPFNYKRQPNEITALLEKYGVNRVVFGHLHKYNKKQKLEFERNGIKYYLTSCDLVDNKLVRIK